MQSFLIGMLVAIVVVSPHTPTTQQEPRRAPIERTGYAAHYSPGLMLRVAHRRGIEPDTDCMVSSPWYNLGDIIYVKSNLNDTVMKCTQVDVSAPKDIERHKARNLVVELDFTSAKTICEITRVSERPYRECPVTIWKESE